MQTLTDLDLYEIAMELTLESEHMTEDEVNDAISSWNVTEFNTTTMVLQVQFTDYLAVSSSQDADDLVIEILRPVYFVTLDGEMI
jgi:hypothetical protein